MLTNHQVVGGMDMPEAQGKLPLEQKVEEKPTYVFKRGARVIVAEVLFPKKVRYQPEIFTMLKTGLREREVKNYLLTEASALLNSMADYPQLFDPLQYERKRIPIDFRPTIDHVRARIGMYQHHFKGWSMYEVDGMFFIEDGEKEYEERTQVLRLIFRLKSSYLELAKEARSYDVLEAITRWVMAEHMRLDHILPWSKGEKARFVRLHGSWPRHKRQFLDKYYELITKEVKKWIDDTGLFVFAYLKKRFWEDVLKQKLPEEEIWTISWFNANVNVVKYIENKEGNRT